jgi:site-specific DNA-cytosine methylase
MIVYDFFSGTGSSTKAFEDAGHHVFRFDIDTQFSANYVDLMDVTGNDLMGYYGKPDFIWASPPCTAFSVAGVSHHFNKDGSTKSQTAIQGIALLAKTIQLIKELKPKHWVIENPRGMMRKQEMLAGFNRSTVTYCQYGDTRMKPTDLWHNLDWNSRPVCKNGDACHEAAPRGSRKGTQGLKNAKYRSQVPYELGKEILTTVDK